MRERAIFTCAIYAAGKSKWEILAAEHRAIDAEIRAPEILGNRRTRRSEHGCGASGNRRYCLRSTVDKDYIGEIRAGNDPVLPTTQYGSATPTAQYADMRRGIRVLPPNDYHRGPRDDAKLVAS